MKRFSKNKYFKPIACLGVGVVMLSAAVFANYDNANGYTVYKNALKQIPFEENFTVNIQADMEFDGENIGTSKFGIVYDKDGDVVLNETTEEKSPYQDFAYKTADYRQDGFRISVSDSSHGPNYYINRSYGSDFFFSDEEDKEMVSKVINFGELLADGFVGDLKNNFVLTGSEDGNKTYDVTLTEAQVPAIVNAGVSLIASSMKPRMVNGSEVYTGNESVDQKLNGIMTSDKDPYVSYANCQLTVDDHDRLTQNILTGTLTGFDQNGEQHDLTIRISIGLSDYGTSQPQRMDLEALGYSFTMKDGTVKTVTDLMNGTDRINILYEDGTYLYIDPTDYNNYTGDKEMLDRYIYNGQEVNSEEYYDERDSGKVIKSEGEMHTYTDSENIEIIGGADGPTSVYIEGAGETEQPENADEALNEVPADEA